MSWLLCPLSDFPYMLPRCVPTAALITWSSLVPLGFLLCWLAAGIRHRRYAGVHRVAGVVTASDGAGPVVLGRADDGAWVARPFTLRARGQTLAVAPTSAAVRGWGRRVCVGQRVIVEGVEGVVRLPGEQLFRGTSTLPGLEAVQVHLPLPRPLGLLVLTVLGGWLTFVLVLLLRTTGVAS